MGRPGAGGRRSSGGGDGGHRRSSGGSGHRVSSRSSSRPTGGSSGWSSSRSSSYGSGGFGSGGYHNRHYHSSGDSIHLTPGAVALIVVLFAIAMLISRIMADSEIPKSTVNREKLNIGGFSTECIVDNDGWFDNVSRTSSKLKGFFKETGVQPYIVINAYNSELTTDADKEAYAKQYYDSNYGVDNGFMYMYFPESNPDDVGYMYCVVGAGAGTVMDKEAQDIFWSYIDYYWYEDMSTDTMFLHVFDDTAERIMDKTKTMADVIIILVVAVILISGAIFTIKLYKARSERQHQNALDTERILNADLGGNSYADDLADKYK